MYNIDFFYLTQNIPNSDYKIIFINYWKFNQYMERWLYFM